jgi:PAS domain S-box-containing protein
MRLHAGFPLSHVQKAFELYRTVVVPLAAEETTIDEFPDFVSRVNACLAVTIHRFSDHFQEMHQKRNLDYARQLEAEVRDRTAKLKESESRYKTLVEEINDGYFVIQDGKIVFTNNAFCEMHGYPPEEVLGREFLFFVAPENRKTLFQAYLDQLADRPSPKTHEYLRLTRNGQSIPTEFTAKVTEYQNRRSNIGLCRDISERVEMERRIREAERMADIGRITASLSHEIRNPLSAVQLNLQVLKKNRSVTGNDGRRIDIAVREVVRLERILKELLDFAKPLPLHLVPCKFDDIVESCLELLDPKFEEKGLDLVRDVRPGLPRVVADQEKLGQALINLLLNAIDASPRGGSIRLSCRPRISQGIDGLETAVADTGEGLHPEHFWEIFKPFYTTKNKGTGLGLTNVRRIMDAHHGWVLGENLEPQGAVFRMWLPGEDSYGQNTDR